MGAAAPFLVQTSLLVSVGFSATLAAVLDIRYLTVGSKSVSAATSILAVFLNVLDAGFALKMWQVGAGSVGGVYHALALLSLLQCVTQGLHAYVQVEAVETKHACPEDSSRFS